MFPCRYHVESTWCTPFRTEAPTRLAMLRVVKPQQKLSLLPDVKPGPGQEAQSEHVGIQAEIIVVKPWPARLLSC